MNAPLNRKLRMALVGGGGNAFIGRVHAIAATLDQRAELVAGALSSDPVKSRQAAPDFGISPERAYDSYEQLVEAETNLPEEQRIDFVSIATPNHTHFAIAQCALRAGLNVVCDKPLTTELSQAEELMHLVQQSGAVFVVSHNYTGYPMVRQARQMIREGELGTIEAVRANYIQGWLRGLEPGRTPARGAWKADPKKAGPSGTMGDVGSHAFNLVRYVTGLAPTEISCHMKTFAPDRTLDDYGHAVIRFANNALGMITASQVTHGRLNDFSLEIDGSRGSLVWRQEDPNQLVVRRFGQPVQVYERNPAAPFINESGRDASRLPGGHPEAFHEAFANVYRAGFDHMIQRATGAGFDGRQTIYPNVLDGVEGVRFIERCVQSSGNNGAWVDFSA